LEERRRTLNKMGDSITKPEYWLVALGFIIILSYALLLFGNGLDNNPEITLDTDSKNYLANYTSKLDSSGISDKAQDELSEDEAKNPFTKALGSIKEFFDVFGVLTLLSNIFSGLWTFLSLAFKLPSFFIETLGLPLGNFKFIVNTIVSILSLGITILIARLLK